MVCRIQVQELITIVQGTPVNVPDSLLNHELVGVTTDSRSITPHSLFIALRGDRFDGHQFVAAAVAQGATLAIVDYPPEAAPNCPLIQVPDTLAAYQAIARWWRQRFQIPVIAVTGSVGKTTTKELIAAMLGQYGTVLKTQANYNNEIGVPKTLLELTDDHDYAVIEMAMRAAGEIALLAQITQPDIGVITNVGTAHIGRLGSEQAIAEAKCELLTEMSKAGIAILNHDNARLMDTAATRWTGKTLSYGLEGGDYTGTLRDTSTLEVQGVMLPLPLPGRHNALNYLAAIAVADVLNLDWKALSQGLAVDLPQGRARRIVLPDDIVILDETYNAGLESMTAALQLLADTPGTRRIAVLGTMKELGDRSEEFHRQVGETVKQLALDVLLVLADPPEAAALVAGASPLVAESFEDYDTLTNRLQGLLKAGDRVLFKASRAVGLETVIEPLCQGFSPGKTIPTKPTSSR